MHLAAAEETNLSWMGRQTNRNVDRGRSKNDGSNSQGSRTH